MAIRELLLIDTKELRREFTDWAERIEYSFTCAEKMWRR